METRNPQVSEPDCSTHYYYLVIADLYIFVIVNFRKDYLAFQIDC